MRLLLNETAAVVIDIQEKLFPHMANSEGLLQNNLKLLKGLAMLSVPVIVTQQYTHGLGPTLKPIIDLFGEFKFTEKISFSCCDEPVFREQLSVMGRRNIVLCGIEAHVCVLQTCVDLMEAGFQPVVVEDCVSSRRILDRKVAIDRMAREGALITTLESLLFELTRRAGTPVFKSISALVK